LFWQIEEPPFFLLFFVVLEGEPILRTICCSFENNKMIQAEDERLLSLLNNPNVASMKPMAKSISTSSITVPKSDLYLPKRSIHLSASKIFRSNTDSKVQYQSLEVQPRTKIFKTSVWHYASEGQISSKFDFKDITGTVESKRQSKLKEISRLSPILEE